VIRRSKEHTVTYRSHTGIMVLSSISGTLQAEVRSAHLKRVTLK